MKRERFKLIPRTKTKKTEKADKYSYTVQDKSIIRALTKNLRRNV